jgi:hypothetical protein
MCSSRSIAAEVPRYAINLYVFNALGISNDAKKGAELLILWRGVFSRSAAGANGQIEVQSFREPVDPGLFAQR